MDYFPLFFFIAFFCAFLRIFRVRILSLRIFLHGQFFQAVL